MNYINFGLGLIGGYIGMSILSPSGWASTSKPKKPTEIDIFTQKWDKSLAKHGGCIKWCEADGVKYCCGGPGPGQIYPLPRYPSQAKPIPESKIEAAEKWNINAQRIAIA